MDFKLQVTHYFKNLQKIKLDSIIALRKLKDTNREFDYIYVDGLHEGTHVLMDAIQSFKILKSKGRFVNIFLGEKQTSSTNYSPSYFIDFYAFDKNLKLINV